MSVSATVFDPVKYKETTRAQWQGAAEPWYRWGPTISEWLGPATELMLDMAGIATGNRVLDIAAGAGEQTLRIARRVGPTGYVLATDIAPNILVYAEKAAQQAGLTNVETRVMDGEDLELREAEFDAVISRVGLIYFPDQQKALTGMRRALQPGGKKPLWFIPHLKKTNSSPYLCRSFVDVHNCRRRSLVSPVRSASVAQVYWKLHIERLDSRIFRHA